MSHSGVWCTDYYLISPLFYRERMIKGPKRLFFVVLLLLFGMESSSKNVLESKSRRCSRGSHEFLIASIYCLRDLKKDFVVVVIWDAEL